MKRSVPSKAPLPVSQSPVFETAGLLLTQTGFPCLKSLSSFRPLPCCFMTFVISHSDNTHYHRFFRSIILQLERNRHLEIEGGITYEYTGSKSRESGQTL